METLAPVKATMTSVHFRSGSTYTLGELAELARRGLATFEGGISQRRAAELLNERFEPERGRYHQTQISAALNDPASNPGMVRLLVEAFTDYATDEVPRYLLVRKK